MYLSLFIGNVLYSFQISNKRDATETKNIIVNYASQVEWTCI
jgi:hypothetical protein